MDQELLRLQTAAGMWHLWSSAWVVRVRHGWCQQPCRLFQHRKINGMWQPHAQRLPCTGPSTPAHARCTLTSSDVCAAGAWAPEMHLHRHAATVACSIRHGLIILDCLQCTSAP